MQDAVTEMTCQSDIVDPARATALAMTLGLRRSYGSEDPLPPFFHQIYFWDPQPFEALGRDGHPRVGGLIPDMGLPRRMWAGGRLSFHKPLRAGLEAEKKSSCAMAQRKDGRSGPLALVTLRHDIYQAGELCVSEFQDLIYRQDPSAGGERSVPPVAPTDATDVREVSFSATLLFRYSALTFNGHRIHYDLPYAQEVEGYDGLVVHGPLLAQLLMLMAQEQLGALRAFEFRATAPLMDFERAALCRKGRRLWVRGPEGRLCMTAEAHLQSE
ncbi:MAG: acyl dehydratase [Roseobacter sp.]